MFYSFYIWIPNQLSRRNFAANMTFIFQKVLRNQPATRIIANFSKPILTPFLNNLTETGLPNHNTINPFPFPGLPKTENTNPSQSLQFYPSFPFGAFLNPISSTGFVHSEGEDVVWVDSRTIWADSVKKKRKKKMNKHKLKKLRKRLRRKS